MNSKSPKIKSKKTEEITLINYNNPNNKIKIPNIPYLNMNDELPKKPIRNNYNRVIPISHRVLKQNTFDNYDSFIKKPSDKLKTKLSNPFSSPNDKYKTKFGRIYSLGGIPCHLQNGATKNYLQWDIPFNKIDYYSILPICFDGIIENVHPYKFISRQSSKELLMANVNVKEKVIPILNQLFYSLRKGINSNDEETFLFSCDLCEILIKIVKEYAIPYLDLILQKLNKRCFNQKYKGRILDLLKVIEDYCGEDAKKIIIQQIPHYYSNV